MKKVLIITGVTGSGKTKLSIPIAKKYQTEIINGDAMQVYRGMDILTAKIKPEEKEQIKHHLFDILDPTEEFSVATYQKEVRSLIDVLWEKNKLPIIVGGSGLYLDSIIYDYHFPEENQAEEQYNDLSNDELYAMLQQLNPLASTKIHPHNRKRVIRALQLSKNDHYVPFFNNKLVYDAMIIFLEDERQSLYNVINNRVETMLEEGMLAEIEQLITQNLSKTALGAIGLKEFIPYFKEQQPLNECIENVKKNTRHLAKRQLTWFRNKEHVTHIKINRNHFEETIAQVLEIIDKWYQE